MNDDLGYPSRRGRPVSRALARPPLRLFRRLRALFLSAWTTSWGTRHQIELISRVRFCSIFPNDDWIFQAASTNFAHEQRDLVAKRLILWRQLPKASDMSLWVSNCSLKAISSLLFGMERRGEASKTRSGLQRSSRLVSRRSVPSKK